MAKTMNKAERINAAMERAEEAMADLLMEAERYGKSLAPTDSLHNQKCYRRDLLRTARRYGRAMARISQVRAA